MYDESKPLTFWKHDNVIKIHVDTDAVRGEQVNNFFRHGFQRRDMFNGDRQERSDPKTRMYQTSLWDIAETFFSHFTGNRFAQLMYEYAKDPENPQENRVITSLRTADQFLHCAYVFQTVRYHTKWSFWQLYAPDYSSQELAKIVPSRLKSKTKVQGRHLPENTSPLLIGARLKAHRDKVLFQGDRTRRRQTIQNGDPREELERVALDYIGRTGSPTEMDQTQLRFFRRWGHPIVILDRDQGSPFLPTANTLDSLLDHLTTIYPRLRERQTDRCGQPSDFTAEFLEFG